MDDDATVLQIARLNLNDDQKESVDSTVYNALATLPFPRVRCDLICDMGYGVPRERKPRSEKLMAMAKQLVNFLAFQECGTNFDGGVRAKIPSRIVIVDGTRDLQEELEMRIAQAWKRQNESCKSLEASACLMHVRYDDQPLGEYVASLHGDSKVENDSTLDKVVYLSPDATDTLDVADILTLPDCFIIGLLIDRRVQLDRSLERASALGIPCVRLPLEKFVSVAANEALNVDTVLECLQRWIWKLEAMSNNAQKSSSVTGTDCAQAFGAAIAEALQRHSNRHPGRPLHVPSKNA